MENSNEQLTTQALREYCGKNGLVIYEKKTKHNNGMLFTVGEKKYLCDVRYKAIISEKGNDFVSFYFYPGIFVLEEYYPLVADFCQRIYVEAGTMQANFEHGDLFFKIEFPIIDSAISYDTVDTVIRLAVDTLDRNYSALDALAHGYLPSNYDFLSALDKAPEEEMEQGTLEQYFPAFNSLTDYFAAESDYHSAASSGNNWCCQTFTILGNYNLQLNCYKNGLARIRIGFGNETSKVDEAYHRMTSVFLCKENATNKIGTVQMDKDNRIYAQTYIILNGAVSGETMRFAVAVLIRILNDCYKNISLISHGIIPAGGEKKKSTLNPDDLINLLPNVHRGLGIDDGLLARLIAHFEEESKEDETEKTPDSPDEDDTFDDFFNCMFEGADDCSSGEIDAGEVI